LQVTTFDCKCQTLAFVNAALLIGCSGTDGGIEGDIIGFVTGRARANVPPVLALGTGEGSPPGVAAG
jgi:hypothetical protein